MTLRPACLPKTYQKSPSYITSHQLRQTASKRGTVHQAYTASLINCTWHWWAFVLLPSFRASIIYCLFGIRKELLVLWAWHLEIFQNPESIPIPGLLIFFQGNEASKGITFFSSRDLTAGLSYIIHHHILGNSYQRIYRNECLINNVSGISK